MTDDPLDSRLGGASPGGKRAGRPWRFRSRLALGLSPTPMPGLLLLPLGMALGPHGLGVLTLSVLSYIDPAVSVALAALGAFVGLGLDVRRPREGRLLAAASLEAALTTVLVGGGILLAQSALPHTPDMAPWLLALMLGICASASSTTATEDSARPRALAIHLGDLDDVLPIVLGGLALAVIREASPGAAAWLTARAVVVALIIAIAGWLLVAHAPSDSEQRVFAIGALLLLGGTAEYLSLSALLAGLVAGALWNAASGPALDRIRRDMQYLQHPFIVLLPLVAGARVDFQPEVGVLVIAYLACRVAGKLAGGWLAGRIVARELPASSGLYLISPGVIAIAFALNTLHAAGADAAATLLAVAVFGSLGSELLSLFFHPPEAPA